MNETARAYDPVLVEVVTNDLAAITEEMAIIIWKTGRSPMLKTGDFATAICDAHGRVVGQGFGASFQLAVFHHLVENVVQKFGGDLRPGDVIVSNDPTKGMTHLPDVAVVTPVFWRDRIAGYCATYSHHSDIGGRFPGGFSSQPTSTFEEGIRIPMLKAYDGGTPNEPLIDMVLANVRVPEEWLADLQAKIAGCRRGETGIQALLNRHGFETYDATCDYLVNHAETATRKVIATIPDGTYVEMDRIEDEGVQAGGIELKLRLTVAGDELTADFTGSSPQVRAAMNHPLVLTKAAVYGAVKGILGAEVPANAGFYRPIHVVAPEASVLNPVLPAAVGGRAPVLFRIFDMMFRALAQAIPELVPAPGDAGDGLHLTGTDRDGEPFAVLDLYFGGWGARPHKDGIDGVAPVYMGSYGSIPVELLESQYPFVVEGFGYVPDSGGAGRYRGSMAVYRRWRFLSSGHAMVRQVRLRDNPGLSGGHGGAVGVTVLTTRSGEFRPHNETHAHLEVAVGDVLYHATGGAGGHGDPLTRDVERVVADLEDGRITAEGALRDYGVVVNAGVADVAATARERAERLAAGVSGSA